MTRLLVSVRSLDEARLALAAGVDLIDLKEPARGSLGIVGVATARQVADALAGKVPLSMALGELAEWMDAEWELAGSLPPGIAYAKIGLSRSSKARSVDGIPWQDEWGRAIRLLPQHCSAVGVVYADWQPADAPRPAAVLDAAIANGCRALLVDTFHKHAGNVFRHCSTGELADLFARAKSSGMLSVLAGSLSLDDVTAAFAIGPDYLAVRGAVCRRSRDGDLCPIRLAEWMRTFNMHQMAASESRRSR
ncbi:MAG TPA: (5-formylfuran-3-yl)methyl phosphate synthase [Pirellulales bacterium]|nr:(5-formylfuran-3-yl)methyl phosphate synthase [Pirellulales bacterium]